MRSFTSVQMLHTHTHTGPQEKLEKVGSKQATEPRPQLTSYGMLWHQTAGMGMHIFGIILYYLILFRLNSLIVSQMGQMKKIYKDMETLQADTAVHRNLLFLGKVRL